MSEQCIKVSNLTKSFSGRKVVNDLSFAVNKGEVFALLGHNGAGKSTTIDLILGLKRPDEGNATILGMDSCLYEEDILVELCESVAECKDDMGELHFKTMPKLQVASIFHKGSYNTLAASYESEWLTEIQVPIRKIYGTRS